MCELKLRSLEGRRFGFQLIEVFKIIRSFNNIKFKILFEYAIENITKIDEFELKLKRFQTNVVKSFFTYKIASV